MKFWDASAIIPLCLYQSGSVHVRALVGSDHKVVVWWGSLVECGSALARLEREANHDSTELNNARARLVVIRDSWDEVTASEALRKEALRLLRRYPLRAADALQLAAATVWSRDLADQASFVSLDERLSLAAASEGFVVLPERDQPNSSATASST